MFFIVWSGWGGLVPLVNVVAFVLYVGALSAISGRHFGPVGNVAVVGTIAGVFGLLAAASIHLVAKTIESRPERIFVEEATGRRVVFRASAGSFFFIPMRIWPAITAAAWVLIAIGGIVGGDLR